MKTFAPRLMTPMALLAASACPSEAVIVTYNDYYEEKLTADCPVAYSCRLQFSKTPAGKYLTVTRVACFIDTQQPLRIIQLGRTATSGTASASTLPIPFAAHTTGADTYYYAINQEVNYKVPGQYYIFLSAESSLPISKFMTCTITGQLTSK